MSFAFAQQILYWMSVLIILEVEYTSKVKVLLSKSVKTYGISNYKIGQYAVKC